MRKRNLKDANNDTEKDIEQKYGSCDRCNEPVPLADLVECPSSWEEIKGLIGRHRWFCSECCEEVFEHEGCHTDVNNCDRATEITERKLEEYAKANKFRPFKKLEKAYINQSGTFAIGTWGSSPAEPDDKLLYLHEDAFQIFEGKETVIVRTDSTRRCFSKDIIDEITAVFREIGSDRNGYLFLKKRKLLVVNGIGMWAVTVPALPSFCDMYYETERNGFIGRILEGHKFFRLSKKDGIAVVDLKRMRFDWKKLTPEQFEKLCFDIFQSLEGIEEVQITAGTADLGQDIMAIETWKTLLGPSKRRWTIQCKHFTARKVLPGDIANIPNAYSQLKFDVFCLMTSNLISPSCYRLLESWKTDRTYPFTVRTWDRTKIESFLQNRPDIYAKYFSE